jgi:hypothetical protein
LIIGITSRPKKANTIPQSTRIIEIILNHVVEAFGFIVISLPLLAG